MKRKVFLEIVMYLVFPLVIWNLGRKELNDYYAMLLTTVPGIAYTIYSFVKERQYNITGIFILCSLFIGRGLDLIVGSAEGMLWNGVYLDAGYILFWIFTMIIRKPMGMYFFIDYAYIQGFPRESTRKLYLRKDLFPYFQYFTGFFVLRDFENILLKTYLIRKLGVEGFNQISIIMSINNYIFSGIMVMIILFIAKKIKETTKAGAAREGSGETAKG